ncbi:unnamed protein product [Alternaria alternata]
MDTTFITIHDLSDDAHILYSSDSIVDILGHTPDEVVNRHGMQSQKRAVEAPIVRKLFASSPKDPRYHMLSHLSSKFDLGPDDQTHEPRAALFLNRFTRTLTVMYATSGIEQIIGISGEAMKGRSFYYCIAPNCLEDAVRCLESAKGNDSIAYMRFFFRDPRQDDAPDVSSSESEDDIMTDVTSDDESEGGVGLGGHSTFNGTARHPLDSNHTTDNSEERSASRTNSGDNRNPSDPHHVMFGGSAPRSSISSVSSPRSEVRDDPIELEAVISCTSDGLVVCLRRARPMLPGTMPVAQPAQQYNGIYAAPWATQPVFHPAPQQMPQYPLGARHPAMVQAGPSMEFHNNFMQSIRDVAVFAWALTGINGSLVDYARGKPIGESQPPEGFPVWNPLPNPGFGKQLSAAPSGYVSGSNSSSSNDPFGFGDPGLR